ncbi:MAG: starch-binding protein, partial [bacterium]
YKNTTMKKFTTLLVALVFALPMFSQTTIYLNTGGSSLWNQGSAKFVVWYWNDSGTSGPSDFMTLVSGETDIYKTTVSISDVTGVKFLRLDASTTSFTSWESSAIWNKTDAQTFGSDNCFTITTWNSGSWDEDDNTEYCGGSWSTYTEASYSISVDAPEAAFVNEAFTITATPSGFTNPTTTFDVTTPNAPESTTCTMPYTPTETGTYSFTVTATEGENSATKTVDVVIYEVPTNEITVKAYRPTDWTNDMYIHYWYEYGASSVPTAMTNEGDGWYSYTFTRYFGTEVNAIFINGSEWNNGQTDNVEGITTNTCYTLTAVTDANYAVTISNCPSTDVTGVEQVTKSQFEVIGNNGRIYINGEGDAQLRIFNITGQMVVNTTFTSTFEYQLQKGIYVVYLNNSAQKVSVY